MDIPIFGWIFPLRTLVVGKKELLYIPIFNLFFLAAGNIALNRQARSRALADLADAASQIRKRGISVWIFPEGTRNRTDQPFLPFKKGAFYMAIQAQVPIVPVVAEPLKNFWDPKRRLLRGTEIRVRVLPPVDTTGYDETRVAELSDKVRSQMLEAFLSLGAARQPEAARAALRP
jgi:1-acyl-sn-glycerol-3-phosphate acyltransferase